MNDEHLLGAWADRADEGAFRSLVERYGGLVYGAAVRRVGDAGLAEEITQDVFARLSQRAGRLAQHPTLAGWLHRSTMLLALDRLRRRASHDRKVARLADMNLPSNAREPLAEALPLLDEAIDRLDARDREVVLLHFAENLTFPQIAARLGSTPDAARMRSTRALSTLSILLRKKGVVMPVTMLASGLGSTFAQAMPATLVVTPVSVAGACTVSTLTVAMHAFQTMKLLKTATLVALATLTAIPLAVQHQQIAAAETRIAALRAETLTPFEGSPPRGMASSPAPSKVGALRGLDLKQLGTLAIDYSYGGHAGTRKIKQVVAPLDNNNLAGLIETVLHAAMLPRPREELLTALLNEMSLRDTALYLEWTMKVLANPPKVNALQYSNYATGLRRAAESGYQAWVAKEPEKARQWAEAHPAEWASLGATPFAVLAATELFESDPARGRAALAELPTAQGLDILRRATVMSPEQTEEFVTWARTLNAADKRQRFIHSAIRRAQLPAGDTRLDFATRVLDRIALADDERVWMVTRLAIDNAEMILSDPTKTPAKQIEWAESQVPEDQLAFTRGALGHLYQPKQALIVLNAELERAHDDQFIAGYVKSEELRWHKNMLSPAGGRHGDTAFRLAAKTRDPQLKAELLAQAWTDLHKDSPDAARAIHTIAELSDDDRANLAPLVDAQQKKAKP